MGLPELVRAVGRLRADHPGLRLVLVGDGVLRAADRGRGGAARARRRRDASPAAWTTRPWCDHYQAADLFALPTQAYEGFGMVTLEALACGTPVVGTPVGATPEILAPLEPGAGGARRGRGGHRRRPAAPGSAPTGSRSAPAPASTRLGYDWERVMDRYEALCRQVAGHGGERSG